MIKFNATETKIYMQAILIINQVPKTFITPKIVGWHVSRTLK